MSTTGVKGGSRRSSRKARNASTIWPSPPFMSNTPGPRIVLPFTVKGRLLMVPTGQTVSKWPSSSWTPRSRCRTAGRAKTWRTPRTAPGSLATYPASMRALARMRRALS
jgi:hypothetical protein